METRATARTSSFVRRGRFRPADIALVPLALAGAMWLALMFTGRKAGAAPVASAPAIAPASAAVTSAALESEATAADAQAGSEAVGKPERDDSADEGSPDPVQQLQDAESRERDTANPLAHFWVGFALVAVVTAFAIWLYRSTGPVGTSEIWLLIGIWGFMAVPGVSLLILGLYLKKKASKGWLAYKLNRRDYLVTLLQLLPGTAIAALGNVLPADSQLVGPWLVPVSWTSLALGTAVSFLLVRHLKKPKDSPQSG
ncbi:hypothetical protein ACFVGV_17640 [Pseudarthrobacter scleromae]|uniref:hypothetical protein n=1 Tax=Pseudarthrobacter scleromae TaxID=158897 RepID=UPI00362E6F99